MYYQLRLHLDVQNVEFSFALFMNGFGEVPSLHFQQVLKDYKKVAEPPITGDMIDAQGMVFLTAGFETTANTLGSLIFHLATHPDVQSKGNGVSSRTLWGLIWESFGGLFRVPLKSSQAQVHYIYLFYSL